MKLVIEDNRCVAHIKLDAVSAMLLPQLEGRKQWLQSGALSFESSQANIDRFRKMYKAADIDDRRSKADLNRVTKPVNDYRHKTKPYKHQVTAFEKARELAAFALFMGQGTGKSKVALDVAAWRYLAGQITGVLVIALKGVHAQWVEQVVPDHLPDEIDRISMVWNKKPLPPYFFQRDVFALFSMNIDAPANDKGYEAAEKFIQFHGGHVLMIVDESQGIKSHTAKRTQAICALGKLCDYRMILTGTPIAKDLADEWSQFKFLDDKIIGHRYLSSFRAEYCIMGGYEGRDVVGHKNLEQFKALVDPYSFRVTKEEELDLPPKIYERFVFEMAPDQQSHYKSLKDTFITMFDNGEVASVANAAVLVTRLQQITSGALVSSGADGKQQVQYLTNSRLQALDELLATIEGKVIIWARFKYDVVSIKKLLGDKAVTYYGPDSADQRTANKEAFINDPNITYLVSSQSTGGVGVDGLQKVCRTAVYYSQSFNAIERWQSEDRIHRIGTTGSVRYVDLVCKNSTDLRILSNLRKKKSLSDLVLGDIRELLDG